MRFGVYILLLSLTKAQAEYAQSIRFNSQSLENYSSRQNKMSDTTTIMDIELSERYDQEEDIYYVTVKTGEPSFVVENDDRLLIEAGIFTGLPTGFRILNFSKNKNVVNGFKPRFIALCKKAGLHKKTEMKARQVKFEKFFEAVAA
jgi:hypothetical protein